MAFAFQPINQQNFNEYETESIIAEPGMAHEPAPGETWEQQNPPLKWGWALVRVVGVTAMISVIAIGWGAWAWLESLQIFDLDASRLRIITEAKIPDNSKVLDREGKLIGEFFTNYHIHVPFEQIPQHLIEAIVAIEDREFWRHKGFDPQAIARATWVRIKGQKTSQGASTITQQVVRNFLLTREKSITRKVQEIALAVHLERKIPKEKILEIYLNRLFLGNGAWGVGAASWRYFGKSLSEMQPHETALLAGLYQSPSRYNPVRHPQRAKARQLQVIRALLENRKITTQQARAMREAPLHWKPYKSLNATVAPWFVDHVREEVSRRLGQRLEGRGLRIKTTIDLNLQRIAEKAISEARQDLERAAKRTTTLRNSKGEKVQPNVEAALLAVDPRTGEILAMVGGRDWRKSQFNRTTHALRSPGSLFKPVIYSLALGGRWKWSDMLYVSPLNVDSWRPRNSSDEFLSETTLLRAFYRSMNTPTVELGQKMGLGSILTQAQRLGIRSPLKNEVGTMLGSSDVTMLDLARMFGVFATGGKLVELSALQQIRDRTKKTVWQEQPPESRSREALSPQVSWLMTQGMRNVLAMGTGFRSAALAHAAAGKTGTANDSTDNWFAGYTGNLVTIVWVGTDEHTPIHGDDNGATLALPIWDRFMNAAQSKRPFPEFAPPPGVVAAKVHPRWGHVSDAGIKMWFIRGREPKQENSALESLSHAQHGTWRDLFAN